MPHDQQIQQPVMDATGRGSFDATGRGFQIAQPIAQPQTAQQNMQLLRPGGGLSDALYAMATAAAAQEAQQAAPQQGVESEEVASDDEETAAAATLKTEDYLNALFDGETLSETFKAKAKIIFETALTNRLNVVEQAMAQAAYEVVYEEIFDGVGVGVQTNVEQLTEAVDEYLSHVAKEWLVENKLEVESGLRTEISENFIQGLKELFENSFMEVPEEKVDLVDGLFEEKAEVEKQLNETIQENIKLKNELAKQLCIESFTAISSDLTDVDMEKLAKLTEGLEFDSVEQYTEKVQVLKESYFSNKAIPTGRSKPVNTTQPSSLMENYAAAITGQSKWTAKIKK